MCYVLAPLGVIAEKVPRAWFSHVTMDGASEPQRKQYIDAFYHPTISECHHLNAFYFELQREEKR